MAGARLWMQVWNAFKQLNPRNVEGESKRAVRVAVVAPANMLSDVAALLVGRESAAYEQAADTLLLLAGPLEGAALSLLPKCDVVLRHTSSLETVPGLVYERVFEFTSVEDLSSRVIKRVLHEPSLAYAHLPLARALPAFRNDVAQQIIQTVSLENSLFVVSTSLGNIIPNPLMALTSVAESLGDIVVLTANQLRMLFRLAGAFGRSVGYKDQAPEIASVVGAALGWRSVARELVGALPLGAGVIPKAAIAFAGTWALGDGIAYYYFTGQRLSKDEIKQRFEEALEKGRGSAESMVSKLKNTYLSRMTKH